jgi:hypothetical protein
MGGAKRTMEEQEARYQIGLGLCIEAGAIEECEFHEGTYFQGHEEVEAAYRLANTKISSGQLGQPSAEYRREVTDAIKEAYDDNAGTSACHQCEDVGLA